jgi:hypothetical protein
VITRGLALDVAGATLLFNSALGFGVWDFYGTWDLDFGICPRGW